MKLIQLTMGKVALVDEIDYAHMSQFSWFAAKRTMKGKVQYYASRTQNCFNPDGSIFRAQHLMHRVIMNPGTGMRTDHRNGDGLDNRRVNLRAATAQQNNWNQSIQPTNKSGKKGVYWDKARGKWHAQIGINNKRRSIGRFDSIEEAAAAYDREAVLMFGEFARTN